MKPYKIHTFISLILITTALTCMLSGCQIFSPLDMLLSESVNYNMLTRKEMDTATLAEYAQTRTVTITAENSGTGTGFFIDSNGTLVTCFHVIEGATDISVKTIDGATYPVTSVVDIDPLQDIAILKIDSTNMNYFELCTEEVRTGDTVYAIGSSLGHLDGTFSNGIISTVSRKVGIIDCIQTTAAISSGNSGGPLINAYGEVVGINAFSYTAGENLNLAIRIATLDQLEKNKNFSMSQFKEWYDKETNRSYMIYNANSRNLELSTVHTYQNVTGVECIASGDSFDIDEMELGYVKGHLLYLYDYSIENYDQYTEYLSTIGFEYEGQEVYGGMTFSLYSNEFTGTTVGFFFSDTTPLVILVMNE